MGLWSGWEADCIHASFAPYYVSSSLHLLQFEKPDPVYTRTESKHCPWCHPLVSMWLISDQWSTSQFCMISRGIHYLEDINEGNEGHQVCSCTFPFFFVLQLLCDSWLQIDLQKEVTTVRIEIALCDNGTQGWEQTKLQAILIRFWNFFKNDKI